MPLSMISSVVAGSRIMDRSDMPRVESSSEAPGHLGVSIGFFHLCQKSLSALDVLIHLLYKLL
jgi:hypothetical protein